MKTKIAMIMTLPAIIYRNPSNGVDVKRQIIAGALLASVLSSGCGSSSEPAPVTTLDPMRSNVASDLELPATTHTVREEEWLHIVRVSVTGCPEPFELRSSRDSGGAYVATLDGQSVKFPAGYDTLRPSVIKLIAVIQASPELYGCDQAVLQRALDAKRIYIAPQREP